MVTRFPHRLLAPAFLASLFLIGCAGRETVEVVAPAPGDRADVIASAIRHTYESRFFDLDQSSQVHFAVRVHRATGRTPDLGAIAVDAARWVGALERLLAGLDEEGFVEEESDETFASKREVTAVLRARKDMFESRKEMLFHRRVLYIAQKLRDLGLHEGPYRETYQAALRHLESVDWRVFLLDSEVIRTYAAQTSNMVFWLKRVGVADLEEAYARAFKDVFMSANDDLLTSEDYQNKLYGLTHFIIGDSNYYQRTLPPEKYRWILDYFDRHILEILSWSKPDVVAEVAISFKLCGLPGHRVVGMAREYLAGAFEPALGFIPSVSGSADLSVSEHRNVLAWMVLADWDALHEGPHLNPEVAQAFAPVRLKPVEEPAALPWGGRSAPELRPFDWAMTAYMTKHEISAGLLGVIKDGKVILERSYGWSDRERRRPLAPDALMRIASLTKPFTAAAIRRLIASGAFSYDDRVFDIDGDGSGLLGIRPFPALGDERLKQVTVRHLLEHRAGWNKEADGDLTFAEVDAARSMGVPSPPGRDDMARWILGHPLRFDPGDEVAYSNEGFLFLGMIIEKYSRRPYYDYIASQVLAPSAIEAGGVQLGRSLRDDRHPREPWYDSRRTCDSVLHPGTEVECAYGGWDFEAHVSSGGLIASTRALLGFVGSHFIVGSSMGLPLEESGPGNWSLTGGFEGTSALARQRRDGLHYVVIFNKHAPPPGDYAVGIRELLDRVVEREIETWPESGVPEIAETASLR